MSTKSLDEMIEDLGINLEPRERVVVAGFLALLAERKGLKLGKVRKRTKVGPKHQSYLVDAYTPEYADILEQLYMILQK